MRGRNQIKARSAGKDSLRGLLTSSGSSGIGLAAPFPAGDRLKAIAPACDCED